ncbi:acylneuraminate cytidylyltransferase family protein [Candidatus Pelagibacter ubique]|uniref:acylneuraminate cytidylyltransferase family protein n=1 Tax=Pelagibacter ubique TaxID=198252 RepID=UPI0003C7EDFB
MNIAIIPARQGSKRIKNKNMKLFFKKPIIYYTIKMLKKSKIFDHIIITSDSNKILNYCKRQGCDISVKRPKDLSDDQTTTHAAIKHALKKLEIKNQNDDKIFCIYPCNPLLQIADIKKSITILEENKKNYIFTVSRNSNMFTNSIFLNKLNKVRLVKNKTMLNKNSYTDAGQFYLAHYKTWKNHSNIHKNGVCLEIPEWRAVDINYTSDWKKAEIIFKYLSNLSK